MRRFKQILFVVGTLVSVVAILHFYNNKSAYTNLPENGRPILELPIDTNGKIPNQIMPMGETINHNAKQGGHPGIDFQWHDGDGVKIYSSMDSVVVGIFPDKNGRYDLATRNGKWGVDYTELESVNPELKSGSKLKIGDWVGIPNHPNNIKDFPKYRMVHWQFGYSDYIIPGKVKDRLCPLTYFSPSARSLLEKIWTETDWPEMKTNAPEICSNYFKERDE
ncbi:hypothetical protein A2130_00375 [Candidatus Woesebacteria bacterium GWC2_33_12]|uniref:Peptidase M23 domain-containing protein n=1 Tax=Candidatus Woesebacteria bacterium GW2011_GWB1_33_22 TaxID=1618566 RepID=A0A0F9ZIF8_9BACT|nr:MAG: hypothetical protein UR29_C0008G0023 [Candidatus Woesebacteria bacterium GW2011_GWC2_33_12]KKP41525.1 MAG: hypothetical protein UR33_C0013G0003 [Candidatus Woesebacteria bacterium GW2011_GWA2_33_20]KKP43978.1 MAG: hypothetical protein UR35_C0013G0003 [Candidatus Woesebacteria bacterium GW2011_GWB1_33_22]KKP46581.1 MAG: hypothetical protein UR37_C0006G0031 [Microgenomates group bacterium GW2011_GWC1_33_28]KKP49456.1 MAG: hypothetical protein UR41_C0014G0003 [Candidatus Woesebacteria bact